MFAAGAKETANATLSAQSKKKMKAQLLALALTSASLVAQTTFSKDPTDIDSFVNSGTTLLLKGDVDGDGYEDLVLQDTTGVFLLHNNGNTTFTRTTALTGTVYECLWLVDITGDGVLDLVGYEHGNGFRIHPGTGTGFGTLAWIPADAYKFFDRMAAVGDLDGDGLADIVYGNGSTSDLRLIKNLGSGWMAPATQVPNSHQGSWVYSYDQPYWLRIIDIDTDGTNEAIWSYYSASRVRIIDGQQSRQVNLNGDFRRSPSFAPEVNGYRLYGSSGYASAVAATLFNSGATNTVGGSYVDSGSIRGASITADFDLDGDIDVAGMNMATSPGSNTTASSYPITNKSVRGGQCVLIDVDNDGDEDFVFLNNTDDMVSWVANHTLAHSTQSYGTSCGPTMEAKLAAVVGRPFEAEISNLSSPVTIAMLGGSQTTVDLTVLGMPGCTQLAANDMIVVPTFSTTPFTMDLILPTPNNAALIGTSMFTQAFNYDPSANAFGFTASQGIEWTFEG